jgi:hypothetical protein
VTALLAFAIFSAGGFVGLILGAAMGMNTRSEMLDELDAADAEIARLRACGAND